MVEKGEENVDKNEKVADENFFEEEKATEKEGVCIKLIEEQKINEKKRKEKRRKGR